MNEPHGFRAYSVWADWESPVSFRGGTFALINESVVIWVLFPEAVIYMGFIPISSRTNRTDYLLEEQVYFIEPRSILVTPLGMGQLEDYEMSYCDLALGDKILLPMTSIGRENLENWQNHLSEHCYGEWFEGELSSPNTMAEIAHPQSVDFKKLRRMCFQAKKPLCYLPLTLRLLDLNTRNIWLDEEGGWLQGRSGTTLDWSKENVNYLHREYLKAQRILDAAGSLIDWLETDLNTNFQSVLRLWNQCSTHH